MPTIPSRSHGSQPLISSSAEHLISVSGSPRTRSATHRRRRIAGGGAASRLSSRGGCYGSRARPLSPLPPPLRLTRAGRRGPSTSRIRRPRFRASRGGRARGRSSRRSARGTTSSTSAARGALQASSLHRRPDPEQRLALRVVEEPLRERRVPPRVSHASELGRAGRGPRRLCSCHGVATKNSVKLPFVGLLAPCWSAPTPRSNSGKS